MLLQSPRSPEKPTLKELLGCDSPEKILKICDESLDEFNQVNASWPSWKPESGNGLRVSG